MRNLIRALIAALSLTALPVISQAGLFIGVSVGLPPPALPVYVQPPCPEPGYMWMPGYWAWDDGYYWVPGTWVLAPAPGLLWTPGYWGWSEGAYLWHAGYWGPQVGFYGGINYGFGYGGVGYEGGYWRGSEFYYNRSVTNINTTNVTNVYNRTVINNVNVTRVSFNGGAGGVMTRPTAAETAAAHEAHRGLTPVQRRQEQSARGNSSLRAAVNGGRPAIAATPRAGEFSAHGVVAARGAAEAGGATHGARESAPRAAEEHAVPHASTPHFDRPPSAQHTPVSEQRPTPHAPQYASPPAPQRQAWNSPQGRATPQYPPRPEPQYQSRPEPQPQPQPQPQRPASHYQPAPAAPAPHYQPAPAPHYQPAPAPHYQPAPATQGGVSHAGHEAPRPERGGGQERPADHNGHG